MTKADKSWSNEKLGYLRGDPGKDKHPERFPDNPEMDAISRLMFGRDEWKAIADRRLELLREGLEATKRADGHWSDRVRWMNWVEKVEKELEDER